MPSIPIRCPLMDFRDFISTARTRREVDQEVEEYCRETLIRNQQVAAVTPTRRRTMLERIDLGASAAEKEYQRLGLYFVRTAEYARAIRASGAIVIGRKARGKLPFFTRC